MGWKALACPYCGERIELAVEEGAGDQDYVEDCQVCCRPITIHLHDDGSGRVRVEARRDDDA